MHGGSGEAAGARPLCVSTQGLSCKPMRLKLVDRKGQGYRFTPYLQYSHV